MNSIKNNHLCHFLFSHFLILRMSVYSYNSEFLAQIFAHKCVTETEQLFPEYSYPLQKCPCVVISMCNALKAYDDIINFKDPVEVKPIARFSTHKFQIRFINISKNEETKVWQALYERLVITSIQRYIFHNKSEVHKHDYDHYSANGFKMEFLRSRWNLDEITIKDSQYVYQHLSFGQQVVHYPYSIGNEIIQSKNLSDFIHELKLYYRVISGRGHVCTHANKLEKLRSLTANFNAYDRIFCDAFEHYGIPSQGYWNPGDIYWHRDHFIRDDILSSFPPDASKAVYYASPMITFVVLQREPVTWIFIFRPFPKSLWIFVVTAFIIIKGIIIFINGAFATRIKLFGVKVRRIRFKNGVLFMSGLYRTVIISAYSNMILLGILYPLYNWIPDTFSALNHTSNYKIGTSFDSPIKLTYLIDKYKLNGIKNEMLENRTQQYPAQYLAWQKQTELDPTLRNKNESGEIFYAALMYDDKMNLWLKGREFLRHTFCIFDRLKPAKEKILSEIRYISVAAGATRLHFILDAIKRGFTCGVWLRYQYLEANYYKNVAPLIVKQLNIEQAEAEGKQFVEKSTTRQLSMHDMYSSFMGLAIGFGLGCLLWLSEMYKDLVSGGGNDFYKMSPRSSMLHLDLSCKEWKRRSTA